MWCATSRHHRHQPASALSVDSVIVDPVKSVYDFGIYIDADVGTMTHVEQTKSWCFAVLRQIRWLMLPATFQTLVVALVL